MLPSPATPSTIFVADDVDRAWDELGSYLLHDATTYAAWNPQGNTASLSYGKTVDELRAENGAHRVWTVDEAVDWVRQNGYLGLHPLCGGVPPEIAWPYLRRVTDEVVPAARGQLRAAATADWTAVSAKKSGLVPVQSAIGLSKVNARKSSSVR